MENDELLKDYTMYVNEYMEEKTLQGYEAFIFMSMNILGNERGFMPEYPDIGIGMLESKVILDNDVFEIDKLKNKYEDQLRKLFPKLDITVGIDVLSDDSGKYSNITIEEKTLGITTELRYTSNNDIKFTTTSKYKNFKK